MYKTEAIGKVSKEAPFEKMMIGREGTSDDDIEIDIKYCGYCHTDIELVFNNWGFTTFPCVGGHEVSDYFCLVGHLPQRKILDVPFVALVGTWSPYVIFIVGTDRPS